uniref:Uncharacterized protein n=1 Tax=Lutzomyia longipalpis TaxID=7200 RepID=A0A240SXS8_LUTLO
MSCKKLTKLIVPENIYSAHRPIFIFLFFSGLFPFRVVKKDGKTGLVLTFYGLLSTTFHLIFFGVCYVRTMKLKQSIIGYFLASDITTVGDSFQFVMSLASIFAVYLCCLIKRNRLVELFATITDIDENALKLGIFFGHYRRTMMLIWTNMAIMFIILSIHVTGSYMLLHRASIYPEMSVFVAFFFPFYLMCLSIVFHGCLMRAN